MRKLIALAIIFLILFLIVIGWWNSQLSAVSSDRNEKNITIAKGMTVTKIARLLKDKQLIRSPLVFNLYVRSKGLSTKISAGTFKLSPSKSTPEIVEILIGNPHEAWVTLIEGWRIEEMAEELNSKIKVQKSKYLELAKEGYMFPDTYLFSQDIAVEQVVDKLRENFDKRFSQDLKNKIYALGLTDEQGVILASIVEREARSDQARRMVASILLKRLKIGMGLNADATVQYALGYQKDEKSWWKRHLTKQDLKVDSPYNTYLYRGLPPTPICNPGLASLTAVASADPSVPYLYYYHDSKGVSHYAKTLEEHNQNIVSNP